MSCTPPVPLARDHDASLFDCGDSSLNQWIDRYALSNSIKNMCRAYVTLDEGTDVIRGYYAISACQINPDTVDASFTKGLPKHPVPAILLARLAVHKEDQGMGMGAALLKDALKRAVIASENIGARVVLVHALDAKAHAFYTKYGFINLPEHSGDGLTLYIPIATITGLVK